MYLNYMMSDIALEESHDRVLRRVPPENGTIRSKQGGTEQQTVPSLLSQSHKKRWAGIRERHEARRKS